MRLLWVNPSFLDYRVPLYRELHERLDGGLTVVFSQERTPERVVAKMKDAIGPNAIALANEYRLELGGRRKHKTWSNSFVRIPYQPGLLRSILGIRADVVIGEGFFQWTPAALAKSILQKTPLVIAYERTRHTERHCQPWRQAYRRRLIPVVDAMLCNGIQCAEYVQSLGMPAARISCGHMCADTETLRRQVAAIAPAARAEIRGGMNARGTVFLFTGRLIELKGLAQLLEAWTLFEQAQPGRATLLIVGDGPLRATLEQMTRERRLRGVQFAGHVDYDSLAPFYAAADVFLLPTLEDNWALVVPEAMACGLPVLCSIYNGGHSDLIRPGLNGWTFDPLDTRETLESLTRCLAEPDLPRMGRASLEIVKDHTPAKAAESVIEGCRLAVLHRQCRNLTKSPVRC